MIYVLRIAILAFLVSLSCAVIPAHAKPLVTHQQWEKSAKGYDFTETFKPKKPKPVKKKDPKWNFNPNIDFSMFGNNSWIRYLIGAILIGALVTMIIFIIINIYKSSGERIKGFTTTSTNIDDIENIENADLEILLKNALAQGLFKDAVRIKYLMLLRTLTNLNMVQWKKDKTNWNYITEMRGKKGSELFMQVTISFERAWYGEKIMGESDYLGLLPVFDQINEIVKTRE